MDRKNIIDNRKKNKGFAIFNETLTIPVNTEETALTGKMQVRFPGSYETSRAEVDAFLHKQRILYGERETYQILFRAVFDEDAKSISLSLPVGIECLFEALRTYGENRVIVYWYRMKKKPWKKAPKEKPQEKTETSERENGEDPEKAEWEAIKEQDPEKAEWETTNKQDPDKAEWETEDGETDPEEIPTEREERA